MFSIELQFVHNLCLGHLIKILTLAYLAILKRPIKESTTKLICFKKVYTYYYCSRETSIMESNKEN